jgi:hypothetical protein
LVVQARLNRRAFFHLSASLPPPSAPPRLQLAKLSARGRSTTAPPVRSWAYPPKEDEMKAAIAAIALSAVAAAAPIGAAQAHSAITVGIHTPAFGIRFGAPYVAVAPVVPLPVYVPAPVFAPPVVYAVPPRVVVRPPVVYRVVHPYGPPAFKHRKHRHHDGRGVIVTGGHAYYGGD